MSDSLNKFDMPGVYCPIHKMFHDGVVKVTRDATGKIVGCSLPEPRKWHLTEDDRRKGFRVLGEDVPDNR